MLMSYTDYRAFLRSVLAERTASNRSFSLNAWSKKLGIAQGFLSEVLRGKKNLSQEACLKIAHQLELGAIETEYFGLLVQVETTRDAKLRERLLERINALRPRQPVHNLQVDLFRAISDWHYAAIMELTYLEGFSFTPRNVARRLGITVLEAESAIERLLRLELLQRSTEGKYSKTVGYVLAESAIPHEAILNFHRQLMEKACTALKTSKHRRGRSEVLPVSREILPEVEKILDEASERIRALARKTARYEEVCGLSLQFFSLSKEGKNP